jgi:hypothetical protein
MGHPGLVVRVDVAGAQLAALHVFGKDFADVLRLVLVDFIVAEGQPAFPALLEFGLFAVPQ